MSEQRVLVNLDLDHMIERQPGFGEHRAKPVSLRDGARKPVQDHPLRTIRILHPLGNHPENDVIRDKITAVHDLSGAQAQLGAGPDRRAKHVAGRQLYHAAIIDQALGLRPLTGPGRTKQNDIHRPRPFSFDFFTSPSY